MIIDDNLAFFRATDTAKTESPAIPLGQADLEGNSRGIVPYQSLILHVVAGEDIGAGFTVTLSTSDTEDGTFDTVRVYDQLYQDVKAGMDIVNVALPWECRNWVKLTLSEAKKVNAQLVMDTAKVYPMTV